MLRSPGFSVCGLRVALGVSLFLLEALTALLLAYLVGHGISVLSNTSSGRWIGYIYRQISRKGVRAPSFLSISCNSQGKPMVIRITGIM